MNLDTGEAKERLGRTPQIGLPAYMSPGGLASIPAAGLTDQTYRASSYPLPRALGGVSVAVNGVDCPLYSVSPVQIQFQLP